MLATLIVRASCKRHRRSGDTVRHSTTIRHSTTTVRHSERSEESLFDFCADRTAGSFSISFTNAKTCHPERSSPAFSSHFAPAKWLGCAVEGSQRDLYAGRI